MAPDFDLSNLPSSQVDMWLFLQSGDILGKIMAEQAERMGFPLALRDRIVSAITMKPQARFNNDGERTYRRLPPKTRRV
jgi:hypothetical protein